MNPWITFLKENAGKHMTMPELSQKYKQQKKDKRNKGKGNGTSNSKCTTDANCNPPLVCGEKKRCRKPSKSKVQTRAKTRKARETQPRSKSRSKSKSMIQTRAKARKARKSRAKPNIKQRYSESIQALLYKNEQIGIYKVYDRLYKITCTLDSNTIMFTLESDLNKVTKQRLMVIARCLGVKNRNTMTKKDLVQHFNQHFTLERIPE